MELKKRISRGTCAAADCKAKDKLFEVPVVGRKDPIDLCEKHALEVPESGKLEAPATAPAAPVAATEPPAGTLTVHSNIDQAAIQTEAAQAAEFLAAVRASTISNETELKLWSELLADSKGRNNRLEAMKQEAVKPMNAALATIRNWFRPAQDQYAAIEFAIKDLISKYYAALKAANAAATAALTDSATSEEVTEALTVMGETAKPEVAGLQVREVWHFRIVDESLLPRLYLMPNEKIIRAQIALGIHEIPGVEIFQENQVIQRAAQ